MHGLGRALLSPRHERVTQQSPVLMAEHRSSRLGQPNRRVLGVALPVVLADPEALEA